MARVKYIRTEDNEIIVFGEVLQHKDFENLNPVSAGFISFGIGSDKNPSCTCYGESISLGIKSNEIEDTKLAKRQILGNDYDF